MTEPEKKRPWWKNGWFAGLLLIGVLHLTGTAVHVQAALQRGLLATGIFRPSVAAVEARPPADLSMRIVHENGSSASLSDYAGQVVFINFWATWCAPCLAEMPAIDRLHSDMGDRVRFLTISLDDDPDLAMKYFERAGFGLPVAFPGSRVPRAMTTGTIPTTVVLDRSGRMAVHQSGMAKYDSRSFRQSLEDLLAE